MRAGWYQRDSVRPHQQGHTSANREHFALHYSPRCRTETNRPPRQRMMRRESGRKKKSPITIRIFSFARRRAKLLYTAVRSGCSPGILIYKQSTRSLFVRSCQKPCINHHVILFPRYAESAQPARETQIS